MAYPSTKTLLKKVKKDYTTIASSFDRSRRESWKEFELFEPILKDNEIILDLGCGNGRLFDFFKKKKKKLRYIGMDNNSALLRLAQKNNPKATFKKGDMLKIPLPGSSVDQIWSIAALHHIPTKTLQKKALREMRRVLKPDGKLVITVWNLWQEKYEKYINKKNDAFVPFGKANRYYHAFRPAELASLLIDSGFVIEKKPHTDFNFCFICRPK
ncbi:MAG: class I SAM-dependent methyltransferase [Patescibacteria group bacterium]